MAFRRRKRYSLREKTDTLSELYGGLHCQEGETRAVFERQGKPNESVIMLKDKGDKTGNGQ